MAAIHLVSGPLDDAARGALVFGGGLVVFKGVAALGELCGVSDGLIRGALGGHDPPAAQFALAPGDHAGRAAALQRDYRRHPEARRLFLSALAEIGVDPGRTCWDWLHLRVQPHDDGAARPGRSGTLGWHRDTWGSNVYAQTNWWAPLYPTTAGRTIAFHPGHWARPLANTSAAWDLEEVRARRARGELAEADLVPRPSEPVDEEGAVAVVIEPGDLLCFSGAQLHASVPNRSGLARYSIEARTVNVDDVRAGRGAPNLDGRAPRVAWRWFHRVSDGAPLAELVQAGHQPGAPGPRQP